MAQQRVFSGMAGTPFVWFDVENDNRPRNLAYFFGGRTHGFASSGYWQSSDLNSPSSDYTAYKVDNKFYFYDFDYEQWSDGIRSISNYIDFEETLPTLAADDLRCYGGGVVTVNGKMYWLMGRNNLDESGDDYDASFGKIFMRLEVGPDDRYHIGSLSGSSGADDRMAIHPYGYRRNDYDTAEAWMVGVPGHGVAGKIYTYSLGRPTLLDGEDLHFAVYDIDDNEWTDFDTSIFPDFNYVRGLCAWDGVLYILWQDDSQLNFSAYIPGSGNSPLPEAVFDSNLVDVAAFRDPFGRAKVLVVQQEGATILYDIERSYWHLSEDWDLPTYVPMAGQRFND